MNHSDTQIDFSEVHSVAQNPLSDFPKFNLRNFSQAHLRPPEKALPVPELDSTIPALPAFYLENGEFDFDAYFAHMHRLAQEGIRTFLVEGTTGESSLHSHEEQNEIIRRAVEYSKNLEAEFKQTFQIVAGTGSNSTSEQISLSENAMTNGAAANLLLPPYYLKATDENILQHFWESLNFGPGIVYSITGRTAQPISLEVIEELMAHPHFIGVKECDGNDRIEALAKMFQGKRFKIWTGNDDSAAQNRIQHGAFGGISVTANVGAGTMQEIFSGNGWQTDKIIQSVRLALALFPPGMPNPLAIHYLVAAMKYSTDKAVAGFRAPVCCPAAGEIQAALHGRFQNAGINFAPIGNNFRNHSRW